MQTPQPTTFSLQQQQQEPYVPGFDYVVASQNTKENIRYRTYQPPEHPTIVYIPQKNCQPQYNTLYVPQFKCMDGNNQQININNGNNIQTTNGCNCNQQDVYVNSESTSLNQKFDNYTTIMSHPCQSSSGITNNEKYLQETGGTPFIAFTPNKKFNRKKVNFEIYQESKPTLKDRWVTEQKDSFNFFMCASSSCNANNIQSVPQMSQTNGETMKGTASNTVSNQQPVFVPYQGNNAYNPEVYQSPSNYSSQIQGHTEKEEEEEEDRKSDKSSSSKKSKSKKKGTNSRPETPSGKRETKFEIPQLTESQERKYKSAYQDDGNKEKKKTKQEQYAELYSKTMQNIYQRDSKLQQKMIEKQDDLTSRIAQEEQNNLIRNQKDLTTYMPKGEKAPFFPYGYVNTSPIADKNYMKTYNVNPRNAEQVVSDIVARREKTHNYDGWKEIMEDDPNYKKWRPKSYYWKTFDKFDHYNDQKKKYRGSYGGNSDGENNDGNVNNNDHKSRENDKANRQDHSVSPLKKGGRKALSVVISENNNEAEEDNRMNDNQRNNNGGAYSPLDYEMNNNTNNRRGGFVVGPQTPGSGGNNNSIYYSNGTVPNYTNNNNVQKVLEGPLVSDLKGLEYKRFQPKDYSDLDPKNYKNLPVHYLNYIRPAGKSTPSSDIITDCFHYYD
ncbi:hypothetical protein ABK040_013034 [Willaertia magna]